MYCIFTQGSQPNPTLSLAFYADLAGCKVRYPRAMNLALTEPQIRLLKALQEGALLLMHSRSDRGPYYTLNGRRLSVILLKELETLRLIQREGASGPAVIAYELTAAGKAALEAGQNRP